MVVVVVVTADWLFTYGMDRKEMVMAANNSNDTNTVDLMLSIPNPFEIPSQASNDFLL
jgi:hypothetical protein